MKLSNCVMGSILGVTLALSVVFTGCIDNSESDGVLAMRQAQAELIIAQAAATSLEATAEAALTTAEAAYTNAQADYQQALVQNQLIENAILELEYSLDSATNASDIAKLEAELEIALAEYEVEKIQAEQALADAENDLEIAMLVNQAALAEAQQDLEEALDDLAVRAAEYDNVVLDGYIVEYSRLMDEVTTLEEEIVALTAKIALWNLYATGASTGGDMLADEVTKELAQYDEDLADAEEIKERYETVLADLSSVEAEITAASDEIADLEAEIVETEVLIEDNEALVDDAEDVKDDAEDAMDDAEEAMDDALDAYNDALDLESVIDALEDYDVNSVYIASDSDLFSELDYELEKSDIQSANSQLLSSTTNYSHLDYYQDIMDDATSTNEEVENATLVYNFLNDIVTLYKSEIGGSSVSDGIATLKAAYFTAKDNYLAAVSTYSDASDAYSDASDAKSDVETIKSDAEDDVANLEDYITVLQAGVDAIEDAISDQEDAIIAAQYGIDALNIDITEWSSLIAIEESELADKVIEQGAYQEEADAIYVLIETELAE